MTTTTQKIASLGFIILGALFTLVLQLLICLLALCLPPFRKWLAQQHYQQQGSETTSHATPIPDRKPSGRKASRKGKSEDSTPSA